ncbi:MAG: hypothetical protein KIT45_05020 [Fimbriimonadia bacterium]|nr:hypothetical protein [Fimbriimonadia bacterium]
MKSSTLIPVLFFLLLTWLLPGCDNSEGEAILQPEQKPAVGQSQADKMPVPRRVKLPKRAIALVIDGTSFAPESQRWVDSFLKQVRGNSWIEHSHIGVIQISRHPKLIWHGKGIQIRDLETALKQSATQVDSTGSDIFGALIHANAWLWNYQGCEQFLIVVSDMISDPQTDENGKVTWRYSDPFTCTFPPEIEMLIFGVSPAFVQRARSTWNAPAFLPRVPFSIDMVR